MSLCVYLACSLALINAAINGFVNMFVGIFLFRGQSIVYIFKTDKSFIVDILITVAIAVWISHYIATRVSRNHFRKFNIIIGSQRIAFYRWIEKVRIERFTAAKIFLWGLLAGILSMCLMGAGFHLLHMEELTLRTAIGVKVGVAFIVSYFQSTVSGYYNLKRQKIGNPV